MVFTAYFYICAQRLCDINANRSPLLFLSMINLTVFEGAQYPTLSFGEICVLPLALLLKSHCKTSAGFQQTLKILKILNMEKKWHSEVTQCTAKGAGKMWFGPKQCQSLSLQQAQSKPSFSGRSTEAALLTEAPGITPQRNQPYSLQWVESHSPSPFQTSRGRRGWKNETRTWSPRRQGHCCLGLILQACDLPPFGTAQSSWSNKYWQTS